MIRSVEEWRKIFYRMKMEKTTDIARRVAGDLTHYYHGRSHEDEDMTQLGNAMLAFAQLYHEEREGDIEL